MPLPRLNEGNVLSKVELVLPRKVVETCSTLDIGLGAEFLSTNLNKATATRMKLFKQLDSSVKISVIVTTLQLSVASHQPEHIFIQGVKRDVNNLGDTNEIKSPECQSPTQHSQETDENESATLVQSPELPNKNGGESELTVEEETILAQGVSQTETVVATTLSENVVEGVAQLQDSRHLHSVFTFSDEVPADSVHLQEDIGDITADNNTSTLSEQNEPIVSNVQTPDTSTFEDNLETEGECDTLQMKSSILRRTLKEKKVECFKETKQNYEESKKENLNSSSPSRQLPKRSRNIPPRFRDTVKYAEEEEEEQERENVDEEDIDENGEESKNDSDELSDKIDDVLMNVLPTLTSIVKDGESNDLEKLRFKQKPVMKYRKIIKADRSRMKRPHYKREQNVSCPFCGLRLKDYDSVLDHVKLKHCDESDYDTVVDDIKIKMRVLCLLCDKVISNKDQLAIHLDTVHKQHANAKCNICGLVVKSERHLIGHKRRVHVDHSSKYLCHLCPASFKHQAYLSAHIRHVHTQNPGDAFPCDQCDKKYATEKYLYNHKLRVHAAKKHVCKYCGKGFTNTPNLKRHVLLLHERSSEKPHQCAQCGKRFTLRGNLKDHIQTIHHKVYKVTCDICEKGFRRKKELNMHKLNFHPNNPRFIQIATTGTAPSSKRSTRNIAIRPAPVDTNKTLVTEDPCFFPITTTDNSSSSNPSSGNITTEQSVCAEAVPEVMETMEVTTDMESGEVRIMEQIGGSTQDGQTVQYIVATPEILHAFGIQLEGQEGFTEQQ